MVFSGIYPINTGDFEHLKTAIGKLRLNDSAFIYHAGKFGRARVRISLRISRACCTWRSSRNGSAANTTWTSSRRVRASSTKSETTRGETLLIDNPRICPIRVVIEEIREPIVKAYVLCPNENIGDILQLILEKRGQMDHTEIARHPARDVALRTAAERNSGRF